MSKNPGVLGLGHLDIRLYVQGYVDVSTGQLIDYNETFAESKSDDCQVLGSSNKGKL